MIPWPRVALGGVLCVLAYDTTTALLSRATGFEYSDAVVGSWLLTAAAGYLAARGRRADRLPAAGGVGALIGIAEASVGWAVTWSLGPGRAGEPLTPGLWLGVAATVTVIATAAAVVGGLVAGWRERGSVRGAS